MTADYLLLTIVRGAQRGRLLPAAYCLLPAAYCLLLAACCMLLAGFSKGVDIFSQAYYDV
ncbi:hypothetical protein [Paenibacillus senegalensis]|uniref:hypothetical protein n=1 Tax=Paenibacillus senegalensis TaxID=1465766 RepID=UPI0002E0D01D|nr:hypothetical protein [Paenibacillus senegalensis]